MSVPAPPQRISLEEYLEAEQRAEEKSEWIDGVVHPLPKGVTIPHLYIQMNIGAQVMKRLPQGCRYFGSSVQIWIPSQRVYTIPTEPSPARTSSPPNSPPPPSRTPE